MFKTHVESYMFPALFALGVLLGTFIYFYLSFEVSVTFCALMSMFLAVVAYKIQFFYKLFLFFFVACAIFIGLTNAAWQVQSKQPHFLPEVFEGERFWVVGQIGYAASYDGRDKVTLENLKIYGIPAEQTPKKVKISSQEGRLSPFALGDWVALEAKLYAPKPPKHENEYNFRRLAWMEEIGATGYVMGSIYQTSWPKGFVNKTYKIQKMRKALTEEVIHPFGESSLESNENINDERAVMAALITGKKTYLTEEIYGAYRGSGLAHLLAISGLHIGLVGGFVFFAFRRFIGLSEKITLRYNTKIPAAILAVLACFAYTVLAGGTLPTLRAFFMASLIFIGLMFGRLHNTLRILMITLAVVLLIWPESLLTASFQMSFAAVFALALWNEFKQGDFHSEVKIVQGMTYTKGVFLTSVVAGLATMPIAAWHFGEIHFTGFIVNMLAIPLTAFVIMPAALVAVLLVPVGLDQPIFKIMEWGVSYLNKLANYGASFPHGHYSIEQAEVVYIALAILLVLLSLYIGKWRKSAVVVLTLTMAFCLQYSPKSYDLIWLRNGQTILAGATSGTYYPLRTDGSGDEKYLLDDFNLTQKNPLQCDALGCVLSKDNMQVLVMNDGYQALEEDCILVDIILENGDKHNSLCDNGLQVSQGVNAGYITVGEKRVQFTPMKSDKNRVWH